MPSSTPPSVSISLSLLSVLTVFFCHSLLVCDCGVSASSLSLCSLSCLHLCMSAAVSPNSNSVGVCGDFYLPHITSGLFRTHLINQITAVLLKKKKLHHKVSPTCISTLNSKLICKMYLSEAKAQIMNCVNRFLLYIHRFHNQQAMGR